MSDRSGEELRHSALAPPVGVRLTDAVLSDRQRVGILLQASSLLCHLQLARRVLVGSWETAHVDKDGLIRGLESRSGAREAFPQTQLRDLATALFRAEERVAGRGEARRVARGLLHSWEQELTPLPPDEIVQQILDGARFLWLPSARWSRKALAAEHRQNDRPRLWVAGPEWFRAPLLRECETLDDLKEKLASADAEVLWRGNRRSPEEMRSKRRWRAAVAAWRGRARETGAHRIDFAEALAAVGRFSEALAELRQLRRPEARVLRAHCLSRLGELRRAKREIIRLESSELGGEALMEAAAVAIRLYGNLELEEAARAWVDRVLSSAESSAQKARAELLAFSAAWDRGDEAEMLRCLEAARPALEIPSLAWRWHKAKGLEAIHRGDGSKAVESLGTALAHGRRQMTPVGAADLWNEMALGRSLVGDLAGSERALLHTLRLQRELEGPRKTTLALFNLAEVRLRRGKLDGVREILEQSTRENRHAGNWRGMVHDTELWARFDLIRGRPSAVIQRLADALAEFDEHGVGWRQAQLRILQARALGWLGRSEEAAAVLAAGGDEVVADLEPEERPALWALAGDRERALESIVDGPSSALWRELLGGRQTSTHLWSEAAALDDYRFARLVFDLENVERGWTPLHFVRRAAVTLRSVGAGALAERLEARASGPWEALERYLEDGSKNADSVARLLAEAGYGEASLVWRDDGGEEVLVDGVGGEAALAVSREGGDLILRSSWIDPVLKVILQLVSRDLGGSVSGASDRRSPSARRFGIVGESRDLLAALDRIGRLAPERVPILLEGETGTGKELAAKRIHRLSPWSDGPFLPFNCAAVSGDLLMSDLFGHVRGAYTGAVRDRLGVFETARGGTVFLDEIGDLPLRAQGFLLRVLQEGEVRRVGESLPRSTEVRVVTATHRDLEAMVRQGEFRADLYYRLRVAKIVLPPLRDRGNDVLLLAEHFLERMRPEHPPRLSPSSCTALLGHDWPGNVRELENTLSVAVAMAGDGPLEPEHLDLPYRGTPPTQGYHELVLNFRRRLVREALAASGGNRAEAARRLGLTRQALSYLVRQLGIEV